MAHRCGFIEHAVGPSAPWERVLGDDPTAPVVHDSEAPRTRLALHGDERVPIVGGKPLVAGGSCRPAPPTAGRLDHRCPPGSRTPAFPEARPPASWRRWSTATYRVLSRLGPRRSRPVWRGRRPSPCARCAPRRSRYALRAPPPIVAGCIASSMRRRAAISSPAVWDTLVFGSGSSYGTPGGGEKRVTMRSATCLGVMRTSRCHLRRRAPADTGLADVPLNDSPCETR